MSLCSSASGCACPNDWNGPLTVNHILNLLLDLKRTLAIASSWVILIVVVRESVPAPDGYLLNCLNAALPALLDCCEQLLVVVEGSNSDRDSIRIAFRTTRRTRRADPRPVWYGLPRSSRTLRCSRNSNRSKSLEEPRHGRRAWRHHPLVDRPSRYS